MSQPSSELSWSVESADRYSSVDRKGRPCVHGKWRVGLSFCGSLQQAISFARHTHSDSGAIRLTSPGFEIVALRDSFSVLRIEVSG